MAPTPDKEDASLAYQCLEFCQMLAGKSMPFSFSLKVGTNFSFSLETRGEVALSSPKKKQKKPTPSTLRRNARRREQFLNKKLASTASVSKPVSEKGTEALPKAPASLHHHPSPPPSSERRQVINVGRGKVPTFNQLDGAADSPAAKSSVEIRPRVTLMPRCVFCPEVKNNAAMPHPCYLASTVSCPVCHVKGKEVGVCEECNHGFDHTNGKRDDYQGYPLLKCKSCK